MAEPPVTPATGESDDYGTLTFEQLVERLEATINRMAGGDLGIEEVTDLYERAGKLHAAAAERLARIEERIAKLTAKGD